MPEAVGAVLDLPSRLAGGVLGELAWLIVLLPVWGASLLAWHLSPWLLGALIVVVVTWAAWSLSRSRASIWTSLGLLIGLALLQLTPVVVVEAL